MPVPRVRAVVLNHNGGDLLATCVQHLCATEWPSEAFEVVVVDNASTDGSDVVIERRFPDVEVVRSEKNVGFPANNLALRDLDSLEHVALVNNDAFVTPGWLSPLVEVLESGDDVGAACPKLLFAPSFVDITVESPTFGPGGRDPRHLGVRISAVERDGDDVWRDAQFAEGFWGLEQGGGAEAQFQWTDGRGVVRVPTDQQPRAACRVRLRIAGPADTEVRLWGGSEPTVATVGEKAEWFTVEVTGDVYDVVNNAGSILIEGGYGADRGFLEPDDGRYDESVEVFNWCGAGVLFRADYLRDVGLFDERFFMYYEDTDLSWRGRARGWRHRYTPTSVIRHVHAATSVEGSAMFAHFVERNRLLMLVKNAPVALAVHACLRFLLTTASYARRDTLQPLLHGRRPRPTVVLRRLGAMLGFLRLLPAMLFERRRLRHRQRVSDEELVAWMVPQP